MDIQEKPKGKPRDIASVMPVIIFVIIIILLTIGQLGCISIAYDSGIRIGGDLLSFQLLLFYGAIAKVVIQTYKKTPASDNSQELS